MLNNYGTVTNSTIASLEGIVGEKNVLTGEERENYSGDESADVGCTIPDVVVRPADTVSVSRIVKLANEQRTPVTPRGSGTGLSGGAVPIYGGIVISLERMNSILEVDANNFTVTVEAGVTLDSIYQTTAEYGLYYPLYPGEKTATIGGNVSTNAGGMRAVKYGVTRHWVLGLEAVLPTGEIIHTGGKYVKCSSGYELTQLIAGSEGTLAVITGVTLRLMNSPGKSEILFVPFNNLHDAIRTVPEILREGLLPVGIEFVERDILDMVEEFAGLEIPMNDYAAYLMIMVEADNEDEILSISNRIGDICLKSGAVDIFIPGSERAKRNLLEAREKFYPAMKHAGILGVADIVVPRSLIADFVEQSKAISEQHGLPLIACGHAGDGNVHLSLLGKETETNREKANQIMSLIHESGISLGGAISGEHGLGILRKDYLRIAAGKSKIELMKRIKLAFDPNNIMNPGKVLDLD